MKALKHKNIKALLLCFGAFLFFILPTLPARAGQNCCVFSSSTPGGLACIADSTQSQCTAVSGNFFQDCNVVTCREAGLGPSTQPAAPTPAAPAGPVTGAEAVRNRLKGVAEIGLGLSTPPSPAVLGGRITRAALVLIGVIFFTLVIYGGSLYLTASGNEEQVKKARQVITRAIIGLFIVLFAGAITQFITYYVAQSVTPAH